MNRKQINRVLNLLPVSSIHVGSPRHSLTLKEYAKNNLDADILLFKKEKVEYLDEIPSYFSQCKLIKTYDLYVAILLNARVWGKNGAVITSNDIFLEDVSYEFGALEKYSHSVFFTIKQKKAIEYKEAAVISHPGANVYYHWMLDILPRIGLLQQILDIELLDFFVCDYNKIPFQKETLDRLKIDTNQILRCNENWNFHARFKKLILPSLAGYHDQPNIFQINFLRNLFIRSISNEPPFRKIYISRKNTARRHIVNEDELIDVLVNIGFEIIFCEQLTVEQQAKTFSEALVVIGPHGSAFANTVFCQEKTVIIDIVNRSQINACFWIISKLCKLEYYNIIGESVVIDGNYKNDNIDIDIDELNILLKKIE